MEKNTCRVVKIDKEALFEFIYENFIAQEENILDLESKVGISNNFAIDWKSGSFIFTAHDIEDGSLNVDLDKLLQKMPATTDSALVPGVKYKDFSIDEIRAMAEG